jgi:hypothetical protein
VPELGYSPSRRRATGRAEPAETHEPCKNITADSQNTLPSGEPNRYCRLREGGSPLDQVRTACLLALLQACATSDSPSSDWQTGLHGLPNQAAFYGYIFYDTPPSGRRLVLQIGGYCGAQTSEDRAPQWIMGIELGADDPGSYLISKDSIETRSTLARAWIERDGLDRSSFAAQSGKVDVLTLDKGADAFRASARLEGAARVTFSSSPVQTLNCNDEDNGGGGLQPVSCVCRDARGRMFECQATSSSSCCVEEDSNTVTEVIPLSAKPCPELCAFPANRTDLAQFCEELRP